MHNHIALRRDIARLAGENERRYGTPSGEALKVASRSDDLDELLAARDHAVHEPRRQRESRFLCAVSCVMWFAVAAATVSLGWSLVSDIQERDRIARAADQRHLDSLLAEREQIVQDMSRAARY